MEKARPQTRTAEGLPVITTCPHCGRSVATSELITKTRIGWLPTLCCNGENGPLPTGEAEVVSNHPYWYASVCDGSRRGLVLGPYSSYEEAKANVGRANRLASNVDPKAPWYAYGVASSTEPKPSVFGLGEEEKEPEQPQPKPTRRRRKVGAA